MMRHTYKKILYFGGQKSGKSRYVDRSGIVGQKPAAKCDEVYEVKLELALRLK